MDKIDLPFPRKVAKAAKKSQVSVLKCFGFFRVFRVFRGEKMRMILSENLDPVALSKNRHFSPRELHLIRNMIYDNLDTIIEAWYEHCG